MYRLFLFAMLFLLPTLSIIGQEKNIESLINELRLEYNVPAVGIGIIEDGKISYINVHGDLRHGIKAPHNTIFSIASLTKTVVAMTTLKLVESGQWDIDEPLYNYWIDPEIRDDPFHKKLTSRHILTHQSGFLNWRNDHSSGKLTFEFEPGTDHQYSGEGFEYLRKALENKFQTTLELLSDSLLFKPLNLSDTRYTWDDSKNKNRLISLHNAQGELHHPPTPEYVHLNAAASMLTTIEDFCKFAQYVMEGGGLSKELFKDMSSIYGQIREHYGIGLGWEVITGLNNGEYALEHMGSNVGSQSMVVLLPKSKRAIILFTNGDNGLLLNFSLIERLTSYGSQVLSKLKGSKNREFIRVEKRILQAYTGTYLDASGTIYNIEIKDSVLEISGSGVPTVLLYPESEQSFFLKDFDIVFQFTEDSMFIFTDGKLDTRAAHVKQEPTIKISRKSLESYQGTFKRSDDASSIFLKVENDALILTGENIPRLSLKAIGETKFYAEKFPYQFEFIINEANKFTKINITENGKLILDAIRQ